MLGSATPSANPLFVVTAILWNGAGYKARQQHPEQNRNRTETEQKKFGPDE